MPIGAVGDEWLAAADLGDDEDHVPAGQPVALIDGDAVDPHFRIPVGPYLLQKLAEGKRVFPNEGGDILPHHDHLHRNRLFLFHEARRHGLLPFFSIAHLSW